MRGWAGFSLLLMLGLSGCYPDPFQNPGNWSLRGATRENIAVQAAAPSQLIIGQRDDNANGVAAVGAIDKALGGPTGTATGLQTTPPIAAMSITGS